jgi:hypothetical protein
MEECLKYAKSECKKYLDSLIKKEKTIEKVRKPRRK